jgi:hypothetical protein
VTLQGVEASGQELKQVMKETVDNEYAISQKLSYEKRARHDPEVNLKVDLTSLQNVQVTIAGHEVELRDLKSTTNYAMDCKRCRSRGRSRSLLFIVS